MAQTQCSIIVAGEVVDDAVLSYEYTSDVLAITEQARFTIDNKNRRYRDKLRIGDSVEFRLSHPEVNGGNPTTKHVGHITERESSVDTASGSVLSLVSSDLGWHLENSHAPIWLKLQGRTFADIVDPATSPFYDPSWGFRGISFSGDIKRRLKQGVKAVQQLANRALDSAFVIQTEPGDTASAKFVEYAKRINLLLNVSPDGKAVFFRPNDRQEPTFHLRCRSGDDRNNVIKSTLHENALTRWTRVEVVGEQIDAGLVSGGDPLSPNAKKKRGVVEHPGNLPFAHHHTVADGEMYENGLAQKQAEWIYSRGAFDSWSATYEVAEHHQGGFWWEADLVVSIEDQEQGITGNHYIQAVKCTGSKQTADTTTVTIRRPGLLSASFGEYPTPPLFRANSVKGSPTQGT